jgi:hypothetical protein
MFYSQKAHKALNLLLSSLQHATVYVFYTHKITGRKRFGRNVAMTANTYATIEELLDMSFSMRCLSYQRKWMISYSQNLFFLHVYFSFTPCVLHNVGNISYIRVPCVSVADVQVSRVFLE